jgi:polyhydroxybutyrate depolymerase
VHRWKAGKIPRCARDDRDPLRLLLVVCALTVSATAALPAQSSIDVAGVRRSYFLHLPPSHQPGRPLPLLLVFHGTGGDAAGMARHTGLTEAATARGYAVVYPEGVNRRWNDGRGYRATQDDVGFVRFLLDSLRSSLAIDPKRIYATGISNGAGLAFRLACELPGTIAAIAPVAGGMAAMLEERCVAAAPVSLLMFQGTRDPLMPYEGGDLTLGRGRVLPAPDAAVLFARVNGCGGPVAVTAEPDTATDGTRVRRSTFTGCRAGREVVLFTIEGGGHTWPGGPPVGRAVGRVTRDLDATRAMLDFFERHPQP